MDQNWYKRKNVFWK